MTRRKQNCPKRMKWEGGEGEEPPEEVQEDEDGDEEDEDGSRNSTGTPDMIPDSRIASPITVLHEENTQPIDLANSELLAINSGESPHSAKDTLLAGQRSSATPPPPILERCSSGESLDSAAEDEGPASVFQPVPPRLATMVSASSPLISSSSSPPLLLPVNATTPPLKSPIVAAVAAAAAAAANASANEAVLDFSTKRRPDDNASPVLNLSKSGNTSSASESSFVANGPLDLSLGVNKKRELEDPHVGGGMHKKPARMPTTPISPWSSPLLTYQLPYFAPGGVPMMQKNNSAAGSPGSASGPSASPLHPIDAAAAAAAVWNGKSKISDKNHFGGMSMAPSDATKALEKMSELSKLGVVDDFRPVIPLSPNVSGSSGGRHSAWQSHWLNKGADQAKDVLKCVWCKQSFPSLAAMTAHMQEAKHCGVNVPGVSPLQQSITSISTPSQTSTTTSSVSSSSVSSNKSSSDLNLLIKETMPLPRKLVRGQDVWLGKGAEQTRQILKCMWCGQSFRSLAEMTSHMQQTQHYTNIISQEQIISWKSSEEGKSSGGGGNSGHSGSGGGGGAGSNANSNSTNSHVSAVLTCKVCDQAFSSLKELSNHMVKNSHYKEHIMRSITESGGRRRQTREKRKKSLPVRKLLELERAQNELKNGGDNMMMTMMMMGGKPGSLHGSSSNRITCEKCGDKIDMAVFVDHIRICVGANAQLTDEKKNLLKNALMSSYNNASESLTESASGTKGGKDPPYQRLSPKASDLSVSSGKDSSAGGGGKSDKSSSPSVLNAIEKLIEKSFDPRSRHGVAGYPGCQPSSTSPIGSSILKRLGIDESVDYTKPLMDVNLQAAKAYMLGSHQFHNSHYDQNYFSGGSNSGGGRRERSGSESSSVSERGSSRHESSTPDRKFDDRTPQTTPEKRVSSSPQPPKSNESATKEHLAAVEIKEEPGSVVDEDVKPDIKIEPVDTDREDDDGKKSDKDASLTPRRSSSDSSTTSKSIPPASADDLGEDLSTSGSSKRLKKTPPDSSPATMASPSRMERASVSPSIAMTASPTNSERSITPRSTSDKKSTGSLGALSSMFDSLSGTTSSASSEAPAQSNKASNHPLAALQKLCDKTETHHHPASGSSSRANSSSASANHSDRTTPQSNTPGAILAFSWACNDAVVTDSIMKCAFCDTPFISKGAYRHHLSKTHFVKDGVIPDPVPLKSPSSNSSSGQNTSLPTSLVVKNSQQENCKAAGSTPQSTSSSTSSIKSPQPQTFDESPHSKFLKYTELAKQLSSKYV
ncbi:protein tiptop isoform X2 [Planococcus citri]|uniref:protein tiptop isoform X2 n=1 Tax=Planococcus citri TaxID=170843 RepID=UPI0031F87132